MNDQTERKAIFVTGAASGIGLATAELFVSKGWFVGAYDRDEVGVRRLGAMFGEGNALCRSLDVSDRDAYRDALETFARSTGRLDILFNNAGIQAHSAFADMPWEKVGAIVSVNLMAVLAGVQLAIPFLKTTPGSLCLSTCSASAIFGAAGMAVYSATKHGVRGLTEALAVELQPYRIRVADLIPGIIDTGMLSAEDKARLPTKGLWRAVPASEIAEAVMTAYEGDRLHWYIPAELAEFDRFATANPERLRDIRIAGELPTPMHFREP